MKKKAAIRAIAMNNNNGYVWKWHDVESGAASKTPFAFYHDCLTDARSSGYEVELTHAHGLTAPGGLEHKTR